MSTVIPTKDRWSLLALTLESALGQEDVDLEVIVVDDGSTDGTVIELQDKSDKRLRVIRHDYSQGVAAARNTGIAAASGEWIAFLDDDDLWAPNKLRTQLDALAAESEAAFAYCGVIKIDERNRPLGSMPVAQPADLLDALLARSALGGGQSSVIARRALVNRLGGFDVSLSALADWDMWIRMAASARGTWCPTQLACYRLHSGSMMLKPDLDLEREFSRLVEKHRSLSLSRGISLDMHYQLRGRAWAHRRANRRFKAARLYFRGAWAFRSAGDLLRAAAALVGERATEFLRPREEVVTPPWLVRYQR